MNSKFLLLAILLVLATINYSIAGNVKKSTDQAKTVSSSNNDVSPVKSSHDESTGNLSLELPQDISHSHNGHHADEDGRTHYYHFGRLTRKRWRAIYCFTAKIIVLLAHLCFLVSAFIHTPA